MTAKVTKRSEQKRARETKDKILTAAIKEFSAAGFEGVSTRAIASRAGVNHTLITHHFGSKAELWKTAAKAIFDTYSAQSEKRLLDLGDVEQKKVVRELLKHYIEFSAEFPDFHRFMIQANRGDLELLNWFTDEYLSQYSDSELDLLQQAQKLGLMPQGDSLHIRYLFMGAVTSIFTFAPQYQRLSGKDPFSEAVVEKHIDYVLSLFEVKKDTILG
ncbi:TetR/AcrR family transcriptional regulator [Psychrobacter sp. FDAARGOS_221]|uniref:TetR/AcrR family transcriptional regulator n=1 Tax=Psychrobacter sp. FDAARGOS_221 TaxID=1975705 RepID=UPI000BB58DE7|nr:TetR/AcrR family transcriptional regulator [Psychrobacter sp. FDAARGOS_221]PNK61654.1 TetR/AcrR family transcriptional regulator [Psychrobacter sp. FDAARGOS_221]